VPSSELSAPAHTDPKDGRFSSASSVRQRRLVPAARSAYPDVQHPHGFWSALQVPARVPPDKAGLAAGLVNTSQWFGAALGLAIFSSIATNRTSELLTSHVSGPLALTQGFHRALLASSLFLLGAAVIALKATNTRREVTLSVETADRVDDQMEPVLEVEEA
jgi:hypothetical protein